MRFYDASGDSFVEVIEYEDGRDVSILVSVRGREEVAVKLPAKQGRALAAEIARTLA
jgi:hypothetical protein